MTTQFRILGAVEADIGGRAVDLGPARRRCVLVALLVDANHVVPVEQLLGRVWDGDLSRRGTLYSHVSRLRRALAGAEDVEIERRSGGYLLSVDPMNVDLHRFRHLVRLARSTNDPAHYTQARALWRGEAFADLDSPWLNQLRSSLHLERRAARLDCNDLLLDRGRHADVLTDLVPGAADHHLDERLAAQLMLALYGAGRRPDALRIYRDTRTALVDELGLDPGPELQELHRRILADDVGAGPRPEPGAAPPRQLPADVGHFAGRDRQLSELHAYVERSQRAAPSPPVIVAIDGMAGVGKTALAVHFGHQVADRFPDGQLYLDLRGYGPAPPMTPTEALGHLLRGLGRSPEHVPTDAQELAAAYRSQLSDRRILIVLDDARTAEQVRALLPGTAGSLVVITSRGILSSLDNVGHVHLDVLSDQEALALLTRLVGPERVDGEPEEAAAVVRMCARLPLAVRIAGARLAARPQWSVAALVARLADEEHRLAELAAGDLAVRTGFAVSHRALLESHDAVDHVAARAFRLLGGLHWIDMTVPVAAALLDADRHQAQNALERLVDSHLLEAVAPGRYHTHDLLRLYARELAQREVPSRDREHALTRVLHCYLDAAGRVNLLVNPASPHRPDSAGARPGSRFPLSTRADAIAWTDAEHDNLVAVIRQALDAAGGAPALAVRLSAALNRPFDLLGRWHDFVAVRGEVAEAAHRLGDARGAAFAWQDVAWTAVRLGRADEAIATTKRALDVWREIGDRRAEQACLNILGFALRQLGRHSEAIERLELAHVICAEIGHRYGQATTSNNLGLVHKHLRRFYEAIAWHTRALNINRDLDDRSGQAIALANLGSVHHRAGAADEALGCYRQSLALARDAGDRYQEAETLWGLGETHHTLGNHDQARAYWNGAITILRELGAIDDEQAGLLRRQPVPDTPEIILGNT